jgi:hypothetical protein
MRITETSLKKYFIELLEIPRIQQYAQDHQTARSKFVIKNTGDIVLPILSIVNTAGVRYAGVAHTCVSIDISRWILEDEVEAKAVVRHEVAHLLHNYSKTGGRTHGKEFHEALKIVSPKTWRKDIHWYPNPVIEKARTKVHPTSPELTIVKVGNRPYTSRA